MRILLADAQPKVRLALRMLLKHEPGLNVVGEVGDAESLLARILLVHPDLILLDWGLPGLSPIDSLSALRADYSKLSVIVLSGRPEMRQKALNAGANAFVSKIDPPEQLTATLRAMEKALQTNGKLISQGS